MEKQVNFRNLLVIFFLLFSFFSAEAQLFYKDIDQQAALNEDENKELRKGSLLIGFSQMPFSYDAASIQTNFDYLPSFEAELPEVNIRHGLNLNWLFHTPEKWYYGLSFGYSFSESQQSRRRDNAAYIGLNVGYEIPIRSINRDNHFAFELGFGAMLMERPFTRQDNYNINLFSSQLVAMPTLRYDIKLFKYTSLFFQARYMYDMGLAPFSTKIHYQNRRYDDDFEQVRINNPNVEASSGARLKMDNLFEFSVGLKFTF